MIAYNERRPGDARTSRPTQRAHEPKEVHVPHEKTITPVEGCSLCGGTLWWVLKLAGALPCPACLSLPVNGKLLAFVREQSGFADLWDAADHFDKTGEPWVLWKEGGNVGRRVIPLYVPTGMDLGLRWLAHRLQGEGRTEWGSMDRNVWALGIRGPRAEDGYWFGPEDTGTAEDPSVDMVVPALATIPDAPFRLRAARALKLCIEAKP